MSDKLYQGNNAMTLAGSALAIFSISEWAIISGIVLSVLGFAYNIYHTTQLRKIAREKGVRINESN